MPSNRRIKNKTKDRFRKSFKKLVSGLNRRVTVYLHPNEAECPNCYYDKVNRTSSGVCKVSPGDDNYFTVGRCPVCLGAGVLTTSRRRVIKGIVIWDPIGDAMNSLTFTPAGFEGATKVEIKTDTNHLELIRECSYIVIDGIKCRPSNPPILRGIGTQAILVAQFFTTSKPRQSSGERV